MEDTQMFEDTEIDDKELLEACTLLELESKIDDRKNGMKNEISKENDVCVICYENECSVLFKPCRHLVTCTYCAQSLKKCPMCKAQIIENVPGLLSLFNISSKIFENSLIFGRAIITADDHSIFTESQQKILVSPTEGNPEEKVYLWFPFFCHQMPPNEHFELPSNIKGIIILEGMHRYGVTNIQSYPVGILLLKGNNYIRRSLILHSFFTRSDLYEDYCQILWFSNKDVIEFANYYQESDDLSWSYLIYKAKALIDSSCQSRICSNLYEIIRDTTSFCSAIQEWIEKSSLFTEASYILRYEQNLRRSLTHTERLWLAMHILCRTWKNDLLHSSLLNLSLDCIRVTTDVVEPQIFIGRITHEVAVRCACVATQEETTNQLIQGWNENFTRYKSCKRAYKNYVGVPLDHIHHTYSQFNMYISHEIDSLVRQAIVKAPANPFDQNEVINWCKSINYELTHKFDPENVFKNIFMQMKCIDRDSSPFILYDLLEPSINLLCSKVYSLKKKNFDINLEAPIYKPSLFKIVSGNLSNVTSLQNPLTTEKRYSYTLLTQLVRNLTPVQQKLLEASFTRTPLWCCHKNGRRTFYRLRRDEHIGMNITDIMEKHIYPSNGGNAFTHEIINFRMHVSTIVIDIDIKPSSRVENIDIQCFIGDLIKLTETILEKCKLNGRCIHYVFQSKTNQMSLISSGLKCGLHYHIRLPHDTVMTVVACKQLIDILNETRFIYPKTIGLHVTNANQHIFDTAIYQAQSFHSLRGPYQTKDDGSSKLVCVFRSDNGDLNDIPNLHKFVHSPHINPNTGNYVIQGRIIDKFTEVHLIRDEVFLKKIGEHSINKYAKKVCHMSVDGIMKEINKRCVIFSMAYADLDVNLLETIANELWQKSKNEVMKRMATPKPDESVYMADEIDLVNDIHFQHNLSNNSLSMTINGCFKMPICLMRAHHNFVSSTIGWVGYDKDMIRLGLFVHCFKESCRSKHFLPDGHMIFTYPFYSPTIERDFGMLFKYVKSGNPTLFQIHKEGNDVTSLYINTNDMPLQTYVPSLYHIHQVYAFVHDFHVEHHVTLFITSSMDYILIIVPQDTANIVFSHSSESQTKCEVFIHKKDGLTLLNYALENKKISPQIFQAIYNVFKTENPNIVQ